jgi:hypothetical protein
MIPAIITRPNADPPDPSLSARILPKAHLHLVHLHAQLSSANYPSNLIVASCETLVLLVPIPIGADWTFIQVLGVLLVKTLKRGRLAPKIVIVNSDRLKLFRHDHRFLKAPQDLP